jgi:hypothetical protein
LGAVLHLDTPGAAARRRPCGSGRRCGRASPPCGCRADALQIQDRSRCRRCRSCGRSDTRRRRAPCPWRRRRASRPRIAARHEVILAPGCCRRSAGEHGTERSAIAASG